MSVQNHVAVARGAILLVGLIGVPARAATLAGALEMVGSWIDAAAGAVANGIGDAVAAVRALNPAAWQVGLIVGSVLIAIFGLWLLLRRPRQTDEERAAAAILAQRLPDLRVRTQAPRPHIMRGPRLLEAVAAMKAETAMHQAETTFRRDRY